MRTQLLLDAIADQQGDRGQPGRAGTQQIFFQVQRYGMAPQDFIQQLIQANHRSVPYTPMCVAARRWPRSFGDVAVTDTTGAAVDTRSSSAR